MKSKISFLYSDKQEINIDDSIDYYKLTFKKIFYNKEQLILNKNNFKKINLDCNDATTEVICNISKNEITQILSYNGEKFNIIQKIDNEGTLPFYSIFDIIINYPNVQKTDINIEITNLLTSIVELNNFIIYETNITNISSITTNYFNIAPNRNDVINCLFKKNNKKDKLLLLCLASNPGETSLGQIDEITLENISITYNFKIMQTLKEEKILITDEENAIISSVYPTEIDFNKSDYYIISYETEHPERLTGIKLNKNSQSELECTNKIGVKECIITNDHFQESGDYYTYHDCSLGDKSISYEITTIKVNIKEKEEEQKETDKKGREGEKESKNNLAGIIVGSLFGGFAFIGLIIFLIWMYKNKWAKKKNIKDIDDIGNINDIDDEDEENLSPEDSEHIELREKLKKH